jgi:hypothetical protein
MSELFDIRTILISGHDQIFDNRTCSVIEVSLYLEGFELVTKTIEVENCGLTKSQKQCGGGGV